MDPRRIELLQAMPIFGALASKTLEGILERSEEVSVPKGSTFFHEGERGRSAYVLEEGSVAILRHWEGREFRLRDLSRGDCFGEMALIDFQPRSATVRAETDCRALELTAENLRAIQREDLEQFLLLQMNMGREVSRRLRVADDRLFAVKMDPEVSLEDYRYESG